MGRRGCISDLRAGPRARVSVAATSAPKEEMDRLQRELEELLESGTLPENSLNTLLWYMGIEPGSVDSKIVEVHPDDGEEKQRCESPSPC